LAPPTAIQKKKNSKKFSIQCSTCEEEFSGPSKLVIHAKNIHQDLKPFKCSDCPRSYQNPKALKVHKRSHENEKRFKCNECSLQFHVKANLVSHARTHSGMIKTFKKFKNS
jgi:KRAB domain-containing zinc finger protein